MSQFFISFLFWGLNLFHSPTSISACYYQQDHIGSYVKANQIHQDNNVALDIEYPVSEKRMSTHTIVEGQTLVFNDAAGLKFAQLNIQLAAKKSFSQDVISSFEYVEQQHKIVKVKNPITEQNTFNIGTHQVYRTVTEYSKAGNCGSYLYFPSEKMAVYFQFFHGSNSNLTDAELTEENQSFIKAYLKTIDDCVNK